MKPEEFLSLYSFSVHKSQVLIPNQIETSEWLEQKKDKEQVYFKLIEARDLGMHRGYFKIISFIYDRLNVNFRNSIPKANFYLFLKMLSNEYTTIFKFKDGREFIEYKSISFANMGQKEFREYFNSQLSVIYEELLIPMEQDYLMDEINEEFEKIISKLI